MEPRTGGPVGAPEKGKTAFRPFPARSGPSFQETPRKRRIRCVFFPLFRDWLLRHTYIVNDETIHTTKNNNRRNRRPDCNHNRLSMPHRYNHHNNNNNNNMLPLMIPLTLLVLVGWSSAVSADSTPLLEEVVPLR